MAGLEAVAHAGFGDEVPRLGGVAMNAGTQAAKEAGNMVDLDSDPTKLIEVVEIGKQLLITQWRASSTCRSTSWWAMRVTSRLWARYERRDP